MNNEMTLEQMQLEMAADKDVRRFIESLQTWYDKLIEEGSTSSTLICKKAGMDPSFLSRTINGRNGNPNLLTIAKIFRAMELRLEPKVEKISDLRKTGSNLLGGSTYDSALWQLEMSKSSVLLEGEDYFPPKKQTHSKFQQSKKPNIRWKQSVNVKTREISPAGA